MEEIDIIELLKRVKEGKAPKEIEIGGRRLEKNINPNFNLEIKELYETADGELWFDEVFAFIDTKIKILDKPIIEELTTLEKGHTTEYPSIVEMFDKINEIIRYLRSRDER